MSKIGRNEPCPCGSGAKYKRCCGPKDEALAQERFAKDKAQRQAAEAAEREQRQARAAWYAEEARAHQELLALTEQSNAVIDLIDAGDLDEAERQARALLERYPQVHDGFDRLGMVCEARRQWAAAAQWYRQCLAFVRAHREQYEPAVEERYEQLIANMEAAEVAP